MFVIHTLRLKYIENGKAKEENDINKLKALDNISDFASNVIKFKFDISKIPEALDNALNRHNDCNLFYSKDPKHRDLYLDTTTASRLNYELRKLQ